MSGRDGQPAGVGMTKAEAAALGREVSASVGFRGHLQRLAGGPPEGPSWGLRITSILTGGSGLLRSRAVWERYQERVQQEVRAMVDTKRTDGALQGALPSRAPAQEAEPVPVVSRRSTGLEVTMSADGPTVVPDFPGDGAAAEEEARGGPVPRGGRWDVERWRAVTQEAIAQAAEDERLLLKQADRLRDRAGQKKQDARRLRRALALVAPPEDARVDGSIRGRVLAWTRAHQGELVVGACAEELGLNVKRVSDAAGQLRGDGHLERVGKGRYRLVGPAGGASPGGVAAGQPAKGAVRGTLGPQDG